MYNFPRRAREGKKKSIIKRRETPERQAPLHGIVCVRREQAAPSRHRSAKSFSSYFFVWRGRKHGGGRQEKKREERRHCADAWAGPAKTVVTSGGYVEDLLLLDDAAVVAAVPASVGCALNLTSGNWRFMKWRKEE